MVRPMGEKNRPTQGEDFFMDLGISGKIAFVSGGSQGVGAGVAKLLATEGCKVAVVARDQGRIDNIVDQIHQQGGVAIGVSADLATREGVNLAVAAVRETWGPPEIVIAQTNDLSYGKFFDSTDEDFIRVFQTFTIAYAMLARAVLPDMVKAGWGRIVHIGSGVAKEPDRDPDRILHNTIRSSTTSLVKSLADEFAEHGITMNTLAPGYVMTDTMRGYIERNYNVAEGGVAEWVRNNTGIPAKRHGTVEEAAGVIGFLCSQQAGYITGEWINMDGGLQRCAV